MGRRVPCSVVILIGTASALAQDIGASSSVPLDRFRPTIDDRGLITTEGGDVIGHQAVLGGFVVNHAVNPLVFRGGDGQVVSSIVSHRLSADALIAVGLLDVMSLGIVVPLTLLQVGGPVPAEVADVVGAGVATVGVGDLRLVPKLRLLRRERHGLSLSLLPTLTVPTASGVRGGGEPGLVVGDGFLGEGQGVVAFVPEVAISSELGGFRPTLSVAYRLRSPSRLYGVFPIDPELVYRVGLGFDLGMVNGALTGSLIVAEMFGATSDRNPFGLIDGSDAARVRLQNPLEALVGIRWRIFDVVVVDGGVGMGVWAGFGTPDLRAFVGARFNANGNANRDGDGDGIADGDDRCPDVREDIDGFLDDDGCLDDDNDADGVLDSRDRCADTAEDRDGFMDDDGCADDDDDGDAILDGDDRCPALVGDVASRGCPAGMLSDERDDVRAPAPERGAP